MSNLTYQEFAQRLTQAMKLRGFISSRSPNGICMKTLASFADASEQICRRYIRGEALPSHEKILKIANSLSVSPAWLVFGETGELKTSQELNDEILHYILTQAHLLAQNHELRGQSFADFILSLLQEIRDIETSKENLFKIIDLALGSASSFGLKKQVS
jgi:transcriptional regulator with XRE-family HTH domain